MTSDILESMKVALLSAVWTTMTPAVVVKGPIPAGNLSLPAIGIMTDSGADGPGASGFYETTEVFQWTLAAAINPTNVETSYLALIAWRDEVRAVAQDAAGGYWGLGGVMMTNVVGWESDFEELPGAGQIRHLVTVNLKVEVTYREQA